MRIIFKLKGFKEEMQEIQNSIIKAVQYTSRLLICQNYSDEKLNTLMNDFMSSLEKACISARTVIEKYRPEDLTEISGKKEYDINDVAGNIEVTPEGWIHITLNTLLPNCRYKVSNYLQDTIIRLLDSYQYELPKYENAFLAIVEYCNYTTRKIFDNDNKSWKSIPNALKGRIISDDDQFHLSLGLFAELSDEVSCHIYVLPLNDVPDFMFMMRENSRGRWSDFS